MGLQVYGIGGFVSVPAGPLKGFGVPPVGLKGQLGQDYFDQSTTPPTGYVFNGQTWTAGGLAIATTTTAGAVQWLSYNLAEWNSNFTPSVGNGYARTIAFTPAGVPVDLTLKDDCGNLSVIVTAIGKIVTLPTDIYEAGDKFAGVNYVNCVSIVNA